MSEILCLNRRDLSRLLELPTVVEAVRRAYIAKALKKGHVYPVVRERLNAKSVFGIKSGYVESDNILGLKAAGFWSQNRKSGEESHQATVLLIHPESGKPRALIDGNYITTIRTAAAGVLGVELFAPSNCQTLAVIGAGHQAITQTEATLMYRPQITELRCFTQSGDITAFTRTFSRRVRVTLCKTAEEAIRGASLVITATPSTEPLVHLNDVSGGVHINAIGSDTSGKSEIDGSVLRTAKVFVDDENQSRSIGELQSLDDVNVTSIGDVLLGRRPGRISEEDITVFDSTGIALQDLTTASLALELAEKENVGTRLEW